MGYSCGMESTVSTAAQRTALYRYFDESGGLLYVGVSLSPVYRMSRHRADSKWFEKARSVTLEWFDCREDALTAEAAAIKSERPRFNVAHADRLPRAVVKAIEASPDVVFYRRWHEALKKIDPIDAAMVRGLIPL